MPVFASFKKDWEATKNAMNKIGQEKPTEVKTYGVFFLKVEKRVKSGIGAALKAADKAEPKDPANPTDKEIAAFGKAVRAYGDAMDKEMQQIMAEVNKYKDSNGEIDKGAKDGFYRALKVFKTKLEHYEAALAQQSMELQQALDTSTSDSDKRIMGFKTVSKQHLTKAAAAVKAILADPTQETWAKETKVVLTALEWVRGEAVTLASWGASRGNVNMQEEAFKQVVRDAVQITGGHVQDDQIKATASALGKQIKAAAAALAQVKAV